jgi:hypothetical protein
VPPGKNLALIVSITRKEMLPGPMAVIFRGGHRPCAISLKRKKKEMFPRSREDVLM